MSQDSDVEADILENVTDVMNELLKELQNLYQFRDLFFENHSLEMATEKNKKVEEKKDVLIEKFEAIDDSQIPFDLRAKFLYMKGRAYNISPAYDSRATQCLSKAVKLNPRLVDAWNELGECYWKNMNVKEAKASFEGALKHERNRLSLRCLSIILRQESGDRKRTEATPAILKSVELAKEAVSQNIKDGVSWCVLGNAYLCQFFMVAQDPATLKLSMSAYKQASMDPIAKGQPDLYYNEGITLKYSEEYAEALEKFSYACRLDPSWDPPRLESARLLNYTQAAHTLVRTRGKLKAKRLASMVQSIDKKMLGVYSEGSLHSFGGRREVALELSRLDALSEGSNEAKIILGRVVGSIHNDNAVPFTFAMVDESMECVLVTVYNWADGRGAIIGDCVAIPEPQLTLHKCDSELASIQKNLESSQSEPTLNEPTPSKKKVSNKRQSQTNDDEDTYLKEAIDMKKPKTDFDRFGDYVALELKSLKSDYYRGLLKSEIRKSIANIAEMDERSHWSTYSSTNSSSCSTAMHTPSPTFAENIPPSTSKEPQTTQEYYDSFSDLF